MILGYRREDYYDFGIRNPVKVILAKKTPNILAAGKSGSGKSQTMQWYAWQVVWNKESLVYLADYKAGEEYEPFDGSPSYASGVEAVQIIEDFYDFFTEVRNRRIRLAQHYTLLVEEWFGLLTYLEGLDKKRKASLMAKVAEILAVGRGLNFGIWLCVQRADASLFSGGSREQFQCVLSFGRCSREQFSMLGFAGEMEENPTGSYGAGQALALIDGQADVQEILVPWITNREAMCREIRTRLDRQPDLRALTRAIAEGKGPGL